MTGKIHERLLLAVAACCLAACGGGGGGGGSGLVSTPTPPPAPSSAAVDIFPSPVSQEFAALSAGDDLRIRYDAASGRYEVMAEGHGWEALVDDPLSSPQAGYPNMNFNIAGFAPNHSYFMIRAHRAFDAPSVQYSYSNLAPWGRGRNPDDSFTQSGYVAFGIATAPAGVPLSGGATYQGLIEGVSTVEYQYENVPFNALISGTVTLNFDFGAGTLNGSIRPFLEGSGSYDLGAIAFANPVFGAGSTGFSGAFATSLSGPNAFSGLFTGPSAQELIGRWAFPFISPVDGALESAEGAMIAKRP